jgi:2-polyprenyl-6-hydroxyphenyl methylase/3-demethylubiquinone-9 3-methyltransferase
MSGAALERYVAERFDLLEGRFKGEIPPDDFRLRAVLDALGPLAGCRVLDLGCGKGRFGRYLAARGAAVVGIDLSQAMLRHACGLPRVRASGRRLPFPASCFDVVVALEVLEHVPAVEPVLEEIARVLRSGGRLAIVGKNASALDARRPWLPSLVLKWIDERRGFWMYPSGGPVRERWFWPGRMAGRLRRRFGPVRVTHLLTRREAARAVFRHCPGRRLYVLWTALGTGGTG